MSSAAERPLFADTNLGTHLVVAIPPDITVSNLKKKLGAEHSACFPSLGEIKVHSLLVKRKIHLYHLPDSMPICLAFHGMNIIWFLFVHVSLLERSLCTTRASERKTQKTTQSEEKTAIDSFERRIQPTEIVVNHQGLQISDTAKSGKTKSSSWPSENSSESLSENVSVSGIIANYFPELEDVDSLLFTAEREFKGQKFTVEKDVEKSTLLDNVYLMEFPKNAWQCEVGERFVNPQRKVGFSSANKLLKASTFLRKKFKSLEGESSSTSMYSVFEINDSDD